MLLQESNRRKQEQYAVEAAQNQRRSESLEHELHIRQSQLKDRERHIHSQDNVIACLQVSAQVSHCHSCHLVLFTSNQAQQTLPDVFQIVLSHKDLL